MAEPAAVPQRLGRLTPLSEALARMASCAAPVPPARLPVEDAIGAVLAADAVAPASVPPAAAAARARWAGSAAAVQGASPQAPVPLSEAPVFVAIGEPMPPGTDAVLRPSAVTLLGAFAEATEETAPGEGVDAAGADMAAGQLLAPAGTRIAALLAAALAAARIGAVAARRPRLRLVLAGALPEPRRDAATPLLRMLAAQCGAFCDPPVRARDAAAIEAALAAPGADAVLLVGGTGEGPQDAAYRALASAGEVLIHGIGLAGAETAGFGRAAAIPVLLLPGRPDAMLAALLALGRPLIAALSGLKTPPRSAARRLARKIASAPGLAELRFVARSGEGADPLPGSRLPLGRLAAADGWVIIPPESEGYPEGSAVTVFEWP